MNKHEIAQVLDEIALLLEFEGENPFKIRAYATAARAIEGIDEDIKTIVKEGRLEEIEGIGESIAEKITILVKKGRLPFYEKLKKSLPKGLIDLLKVPGLGPKKIRRLYDKLKIHTVKDLMAACRDGKVRKISGFGAKTEEAILGGLTQIKTYAKRSLWWDADMCAEPILTGLAKLKTVKKVEIAGSLRRKLETVGDIDFLVASSSAPAVIDWFTTQSWVQKVIAKGTKKASVRHAKGMQIDLRVIPEKQFASALIYFTGSKQHNIKLRSRALELGFSLSEYGLESAKNVPNTEAGIYKALGLSYIPPELREDMGEIEYARKKNIPPLIEEKDIRGLFHCHTTSSDGHNTLQEMVTAAEDLDFEYIGISDHSQSSVQANGMKEDRLFEQVEEIDALNRSKKFSTHAFAGIECDILPNGKLDFSDDVLKELDFVIVSIHRSSKGNMTNRMIKAIENPYATMVAHPTGRLLLKREPYTINMEKVIDACIANDTIMEINAHPMRLDMDWRLWRKAAEKGLMCAINPDAHSVDDLLYYKAGVQIARKGWLQKKDVKNTESVSAIKKYLNAS